VVLFLDEPTSGLDPVASRGVHELIDQLRQGGVTIFLTTHRLEEAERLCDRVAILNTTLRPIGRPDELRERLFDRTLTVRTLAPLPEPDRVFAGLPGVEGWHQDGAREEFLLGKALACFVPSVAIAYAVFVLFAVLVELFAQPGIAPALLRGSDLLAQLVFTPLLAGWSIWVGIAISTRASEVRVAQQLGLLANLPPVLVTTLLAFEVVTPTLAIAVGGALLLLVLNRLGWRVTSAMFDRERLITGTR